MITSSFTPSHCAFHYYMESYFLAQVINRERAGRYGLTYDARAILEQLFLEFKERHPNMEWISSFQIFKLYTAVYMTECFSFNHLTFV